MNYRYIPPDFALIEDQLRSQGGVRDAMFLAAPAAGIAPDRFYTSTKHPTYVRLSQRWQLVERQRIDCAVIFEQTTGALACIEPQRLRCGVPVLVGQAALAANEEAWRKPIDEAGAEGIYVHASGFAPCPALAAEYAPEAEIDYEALADLIEAHQAERSGSALWVIGPSAANARGRRAMAWLIAHGYVGALFSGNEMALRDIEGAMLGASPDHKTAAGWRMRLAVRNKLRQIGSIHSAIEADIVRDGILWACHTYDVPVVLAASIRDDSPLPEVITDALAARNAMREFAEQATAALMTGSVPQEIAAERMLPLYASRNGALAPVDLVAVHASAFSLAKLTQHSAHQALGLICGVEDFLSGLVMTLKRRTLYRQRSETLDHADTLHAPQPVGALELASGASRAAQPAYVPSS